MNMNTQEKQEDFTLDLGPKTNTIKSSELSESVSVELPVTINEEERRRQAVLDLIDSSHDKHFVFFFGLPASGKTAVLGSMLNAMQQPGAKGRLFIHGVGDNFFQQGLALWKNISEAFSNRRFPPRTNVDSIIQLLAAYEPSSTEDSLNIVFLEMSGEKLQKVMISPDGGRALPFDINIFLNIPKVKIVFIITAAWNEARKSDPIINDFLTNLHEKHNNLFKSRFLLLITKWDSRKNQEEDVVSFVQDNMKLTWAKLNDRKNIFQPFSIGKVISITDDGKPGQNDIIEPFDIDAGQRLFYRIYETFTGTPTPSNAEGAWTFRSIYIKIIRFFGISK